jgi:hypothetical protein
MGKFAANPAGGGDCPVTAQASADVGATAVADADGVAVAVGVTGGVAVEPHAATDTAAAEAHINRILLSRSIRTGCHIVTA